jgi:hypothetical protein
MHGTLPVILIVHEKMTSFLCEYIHNNTHYFHHTNIQQIVAKAQLKGMMHFPLGVSLNIIANHSAFDMIFNAFLITSSAFFCYT